MKYLLWSFILGTICIAFCTLTLEAQEEIKFNYYKAYWGKVTVDYKVIYNNSEYDLDQLGYTIKTKNHADKIKLKAIFSELQLGYDESFKKIKDKEAHLFFMEIPDSPSHRAERSNGYQLITTGTQQLTLSPGSNRSISTVEIFYDIDNSNFEDIDCTIFFKPLVKPSFSNDILFSFDVKQSLKIAANASLKRKVAREEEIKNAYENMEVDLLNKESDIRVLRAFLSKYPDLDDQMRREIKKRIRTIIVQTAPRIGEAQLVKQIEKRIDIGDISKANQLIREYLEYHLYEKYRTTSNLAKIKYYQIKYGSPNEQMRYASIFLDKHSDATDYVQEVQIILDSLKVLQGPEKYLTAITKDSLDSIQLVKQLKRDSLEMILLESLNEEVMVIDKIKTFEYNSDSRSIDLNVQGAKNKVYKLVLTDMSNTSNFTSVSFKSNVEKTFSLDTHGSFANLKNGSYQVSIQKENGEVFEKLNQAVVLEKGGAMSGNIAYIILAGILILLYFAYQRFIKI